MSTSDSANAMSLGWDCLFVQTMEDMKECFWECFCLGTCLDTIICAILFAASSGAEMISELG